MLRVLCVIAIVNVAMLSYAQDKKPETAKPEPAKQETTAKVELKPGDMSDPTEILKKVDAAAKAVKSVRYKASAKASGAAKTQLPFTVEGVVTLGGDATAPPLPTKFRIEAKFQPPGSSEPVEALVGSDGDKFWLIDHKAKTAYADIEPAVLGRRGQAATALSMVEFIHAQPFSDEINAKKKELRGTKKIGNEECYEIYVMYAMNDSETVWFVSKKDFLPRRCDRIVSRGGQTGAMELEISELTVDPKLTDDPYKLVVPEGYKQSDEVAP